MKTLRHITPVLLLLGSLTACERTKSETPLSPLIAGPIEGVEITTPVLLEPELNRQFKPDQQPLTLLIENPSSNSPRPFQLTVQIATDANFTNIVHATTTLEPGTGNGRTAYQLPEALEPGRVYYWRVKADDGANASEFTAARAFEVLEPVIIGVPTLVSPIGGVRTTSRRPALTVTNAPVSGPYAPLTYYFEAALDTTFASRVIAAEAVPGSGETSIAPVMDLAVDTLHYWRVRVSDGEVTGDWSPVETFRTPLAITPPPPPPGGGNGDCASDSGPAIVACIEASYPSYLAAGVSSSQREANMEFLRDRVIEAGICGGLDLAWNLKRGTGPRSIDALAWRTAGGDEVVDIGLAFDDTSTTLRLQWGIVAGPPGYDEYQPRPSCRAR